MRDQGRDVRAGLGGDRGDPHLDEGAVMASYRGYSRWVENPAVKKKSRRGARPGDCTGAGVVFSLPSSPVKHLVLPGGPKSGGM